MPRGWEQGQGVETGLACGNRPRGLLVHLLGHCICYGVVTSAFVCIVRCMSGCLVHSHIPFEIRGKHNVSFLLYGRRMHSSVGCVTPVSISKYMYSRWASIQFNSEKPQTTMHGTQHAGPPAPPVPHGPCGHDEWRRDNAPVAAKIVYYELRVLDASLYYLKVVAAAAVVRTVELKRCADQPSAAPVTNVDSLDNRPRR